MTLKERLEYIWDWIIVWYLRDKPKDIYKTIRHWWYCNGKNPYHWKLVYYSMFHHYGWNNSFNWEVIRLCILKSKYYFERNTHTFISLGHLNQILRWQQIAINLLDIILEKREMWKMIGDGEISQYKCLIYVNQKNIKRFAVQVTNFETGEIYQITKYLETEPHELYREKAKKLLLRLLDTYANDWWD